VEVEERHVPVWEGRERRWAAGVGDAFRLGVAEGRLLPRPKGDFDLVLVGYPGHADLTAARRAARGRPVVFNPLVSLYDTFVSDRSRFRDGSLRARLLRAIDRRALGAADLVVADTEANARYFAELADLPASRFRVCFVGAEERLFAPPWTDGDSFLFVGTLIPLHGVETILAAARLVPHVRIRIVGSGQLDGLLAERPPNVEWVRSLPYDELPAAYRRALAALGTFGTTDKAGRVIPNKVFQALACGAPVLTADTPAARELLDERSAVLVPPGNAEALAEAMARLDADEGLRTRVAQEGRSRYRERASEAVLGTCWRAALESVL
jgi:glycosyltransferase involved in cell wall biosynthesis